MGILCGLGAALGQAGGLVTSRQGLVGDFSALSGNLIRLTTAALAIWVLASITGKARSSVTALRANPRAIWIILGGAFAGPFIGVWLSLIAVQRAPLGIASTLMSLPPVILLPVSHFLFAERITRPAVLGTFLAFVGTAILFL
ncbi:MAG: DMT family transporter [Anaerolineae bacterium]|nr:DMT family transporter [Anaerolineae bacterium]